MSKKTIRAKAKASAKPKMDSKEAQAILDNPSPLIQTAKKGENKLMTPVGDKVNPFTGSIDNVKIPSSAGEVIGKPVLPLKQIGEGALELGIYQVKEGYYMRIMSHQGVGVAVKKGHLQADGTIQWAPEFKASHAHIYKFIKDNQPDKLKGSPVKEKK